MSKKIIALVLLGALAAAAAITALVIHSIAPPTGPVPVLWDRTPCARCLMLVGEPSFAAQLQTVGGEVLDFDDPGCLILYLDEAAPEVAAMYFRHHREDRWIPAADVAFVDAEPTPMGYGLGAVAGSGPGLPESAIGFAEARRRMRQPGKPAATSGPDREDAR